jgi:hypothetical protein
MYVCVCPHYRGVQYIRVVDQVSFITGARSLNEEDLCKNLQVIKVPQVDIETIHSKLGVWEKAGAGEARIILGVAATHRQRHMVWVEFVCPGHGKGPWDGLGAIAKSKATLDIMHDKERTSTAKITSPILIQLLVQGMLACARSRTRIQLLWSKSHGARLYAYQADLLDRRPISCHGIIRDSGSRHKGCRDCGEGARKGQTWQVGKRVSGSVRATSEGESLGERVSRSGSVPGAGMVYHTIDCAWSLISNLDSIWDHPVVLDQLIGSLKITRKLTIRIAICVNACSRQASVLGTYPLAPVLTWRFDMIY